MARWVWDNLGTLFLALFLSVLVWIVAYREENPLEERTLAQSVPIELVNQPSDLIRVGEVVSRTQVTISAPRQTWLRLGPQHVRIYADLSGVQPGPNLVTLQREVRVPDARVVRLEPETISINLERKDSREVPIDITVMGEPATGYAVDTPVISLTQVLVSGPASAVASVSQVVGSLSVADSRRDFNGRVTLTPLDADGNPVPRVTLEPNSAQVRVPITQRQGFREVAVRVQYTGTVALGYQLTGIQVSPSIITIASADPRLVEQMPGFVNTQVLDLTGASDDVVRRLPLELPTGVTAIGEQVVTVQASIAAIEYSLTVERVLETRGLAPGLTATVSPETVGVLILGPLPVLDDLTLGDVRVLVDLVDLGPGTYQITPTIELLPENLHAENMFPSQVEVTIATVTPTPAALPEVTTTPTRTPRPTPRATPQP